MNSSFNINYQNVFVNPVTSFNRVPIRPVVPPDSTIHPRATVIGNVILGQKVFVAPGAVIRADEGTPIYIGNNSNIQDGVVIHGLKNKPGQPYSVAIGNNVSVGHQALIHGPAHIGDNTFIGFQAAVFNANVGKNCVLEMGVKVTDCHIPDGRYVPVGMVVDTQEKANNLPTVNDNYQKKDFNEHVVEVNKELAQGYGVMYTPFYPPTFQYHQMPVIQPGNIMLKFKGKQ
ncbi:MAG: DapH/DapD/GlmU-related protein [Cyanobacteriota bacterium]